MDSPSTFYMREYYFIKSQSHNTDAPTDMKDLLCEQADEYYKDMDDEIQSLMRRYTWEVVPWKSVDDENVLPVTWYFKCKKKPDCTISKFKAQYCVRGDVQKKMSPETLNSYLTVVQ